MLAKKLPLFIGTKRVIITSLTMASMLFSTTDALSGDTLKREGHNLTYKGNVIELNEASIIRDTVMIEDPVTGSIGRRITERYPAPMPINGHSGKLHNIVYTESNFTGPALAMYLLTHMEQEINKLDDGGYHISMQT
jgi:hypothetical protein